MSTFFRNTQCVLYAAAAISFAGGCAAPPRTPPVPVRVPGADTIPVPLDELGRRTYKGVQGGLFPGGSNAEPADHDAIGLAHRNLVRRLNVNGTENGNGRIVLLSVGSAGASSVWCSVSSAPPCNSWSLTGRAVADPTVNHAGLVIVNGAMRDAELDKWATTASANYIRIRDTRLAPLGLSENQVQVIWMGLRDTASALPLTATAADASARLQRFGATIRALKQRYPNLQLLFLSSSRYGGYSNNGEPEAYESGFVVKWIVESQINQSRAQLPNADAGDLSPVAVAPWLSWGPYFWSRGSQARADGLSWTRSDFDSAGEGLSQAGEAKLAGRLLDFFKSSPYTKCWFLAGQPCG